MPRPCPPLAAVAASFCVVLGASLPAQNWTQLKPTTSPAARNAHALSSDFLRRRVVLFGGSTNSTDTWEWNGTTWTQLKPTTTPQPVRHLGLSFDMPRRKTVLFGGRLSTGTRLNETFEWDGNNWTKVTTAAAPSTRYGLGQAFDWTRNVTVVFSGLDGTPYAPDTWTYDGKNWTQVSTGGPPGRIYPAMVYDNSRQVVVLFAGYARADLGDTWEWNGTSWKQIQTTNTPPARWGHGMSYDFAQRRVVMYGGYASSTSTTFNDTWTYDGKDWTLLKPATSPSPRRLHWMAHDFAGNGTLLFGGSGGAGETWRFKLGTPASYTPYGQGCKGTAGTPALAAASGSLPWIGSSFTCELKSLPASAPVLLVVGVSNQQWGPIPLPLKLDGLGMTGCSLNASFELSLPLTASAGVAKLTIPLPNDTGLVGSKDDNQGIVVDAQANARGLTSSNGAEATIGKK